MEFRHLYYFVCVANEKSFTAAAKKLHVSQPSLSKVIQNLEYEMNAQLISRTTKRFSLTQIGFELYDEGIKIVSHFEDLENYIKDLSRCAEGTIRFGIPPILSTTLIPSFYSGFRKSYPKIKIIFIEEGAKSIKEKIRNETLDIGIVIKPAEQEHFKTTDILEDQSVLVLYKAHSLANNQSVTISDLQGESLILLGETYQLYHNIIEECRVGGFDPEIIGVSPNWDFLLELVKIKQGITILPRPILQKFHESIDKSELVYIPFKNNIFSWEVVAITKLNKIIPYKVKVFLEYLKKNATL